MNMNATLILQSIAMMVFVWFCMKFIWPPLLKAMDERRAKIADGLAASDRAEKALAEANKDVEQQIKVARDKAGEIVAHVGTNTEEGIGSNQMPPEQWRTGYVVAAHGVATNAEGDLFVAEFSSFGRVHKFELR